jgi:hypothetical protein
MKIENYNGLIRFLSFISFFAITMFVFYFLKRKSTKKEAIELQRKIEVEEGKRILIEKQTNNTKESNVKTELKNIKPLLMELEIIEQQMYQWFKSRIYMDVSYILAEINSRTTFQNTYEEMFYSLSKKSIQLHDFQIFIEENYPGHRSSARKLMKRISVDPSLTLDFHTQYSTGGSISSFPALLKLLEELISIELYSDILSNLKHSLNKNRSWLSDLKESEENEYTKDLDCVKVSYGGRRSFVSSNLAKLVIDQPDKIKNSNCMYFLCHKTFDYFENYEANETMKKLDSWRKEKETEEIKYLALKDNNEQSFEVPFFETKLKFQTSLNKQHICILKITIPKGFFGKQNLVEFCNLNNIELKYFITGEIEISISEFYKRIDQKRVFRMIYLNLIAIKTCALNNLEYFFFLIENSSEKLYLKLKKSPFEFCFEKFDFNNGQNRVSCFNIYQSLKKFKKNKSPIPNSVPHEFRPDSLRSCFLLIENINSINTFVMGDIEWLTKLNQGESITINLNLPITNNNYIEAHMKAINQYF